MQTNIFKTILIVVLFTGLIGCAGMSVSPSTTTLNTEIQIRTVIVLMVVMVQKTLLLLNHLLGNSLNFIFKRKF